MTEKELVMKAVREFRTIVPLTRSLTVSRCSAKGLAELDRGEGIPHEEIKRQLASWLTS